MGREKKSRKHGDENGDSEQRNMGIRTFPRVNSGVKRIRALSDTLFSESVGSFGHLRKG